MVPSSPPVPCSALKTASGAGDKASAIRTRSRGGSNTSTAYPRYVAAPRAYGISAITDQHLAGAGMCFLEFLIFGIAMAAVFLNFLIRDEQRAAMEDRIAGRVPAGL